jgi:trans-aconitate 2-methyltransferase
MGKCFLAIWGVFHFFLGSLAANQGISQANEYQNNSGHQWEMALGSLKKFSFNENDKVLDVGCGDGKITALIAKQVPYGMVVGLDISKEMISLAKSSFSRPNLLFVQGNAKAIPFKQQFDKVVSFCTLNWVVEQEQALQSLKESLKPGGALLIVVPGRTEFNLGTIYEKLAYSEEWSSYFPNFKKVRAYFTPEEYQALLEKLQFQIHSFESEEKITIFKDKETFLGHIRPLVNSIDHLSPELQDRFIREILAQKMQDTDLVFPDGSIGLRTLKIEVIALNPLE